MLVGICKALTTFIEATNALSCYICSYKNKPSSTYFTNTYMTLIIFMKNSLSAIQLLLMLNLIGATKTKWKLLISKWERHKGHLSSKQKKIEMNYFTWDKEMESVETENSSHTPTPNKGRKMILKRHAQSFKQWKGSLNPN